ncbi:MAG: TIGR01212 family radical SAM protein [Planctomycetes bacterium]|nr:TIGR01212 family radical SAM protein [Planctomycetota bacterium]
MLNEPWFRQLRYYPFSQYLKKRFGCRVHKVTLHAGFTCPNRDGTCGVGGCIYCVNQSFSPVAGKSDTPIREQMKRGMKFLRRRSGPQKFIAYFQPFSNTYADVETLKARYDAALCDDAIVGISIGTRPDCVPDAVLDLVQSYTDRYEVWLEYGIQSIHERTLRLINRGHLFDAFEDAVQRTRGRGIKICAHTILGLPGETRDDMIETSRAVSDLGVDGIKLHHLYVAKETPLHEMYKRREVRVMSAEEYVPLVCDCLEVIRSDVAVQRLVGDTHGDMLVAPVWPQKKSAVFAAISAELRKRGSYQGAKCGRSVSAHVFSS